MFAAANADIDDKREWLRGGASPCQGEGRGFESRLALFSFARKSGNHAGFRAFLCLKEMYQFITM